MSLKTADPKGRVDVALYRSAAVLAEQVGAKKAWDWGLGDVVERILENAGLSKPVTALGIAEQLGIVRRKRAIR